MLATIARTAVYASVLFSLTACGSQQGVFSSPTQHEDRAMRVNHVAGSALSVINANGSVTAQADHQATSDQVRVEARLFSKSTERLAFARLHADREGDGSLRVWVEWPAPGRQQNEGARIRVILPDADGVSVRTSNGAIHAEGFAGRADLTTSNGAVVARDHRGEVVVATSNASVRAEHVSGPIDIVTSNGSVVVEHASAPVLVETSNASVSVHTDDQNQGPVRVRTSNGRIELSLGDAFSGILRLGTSNGSIRAGDINSARLIESSKNYTELQFGNDTTVSAAKTSNGSISVTSH